MEILKIQAKYAVFIIKKSLKNEVDKKVYKIKK